MKIKSPVSGHDQSDNRVFSLQRDANFGHCFSVLQEGDFGRLEAECYIQQQYQHIHGAKVTRFLPALLTMHLNEQLHACLGLRPGSETPLFLEQYLDSPIDQTIAGLYRVPVNRNSIVEIGNLVATHRGGSLMLFLVMTAAVEYAGFQWLTFTATPQVEKLIQRLGFNPSFLTEARADALIGEAEDWGRYYDSHPSVMAGLISEAMQALRSQRFTRRALDDSQDQIVAMGEALKRSRWAESK